MKTPLKWILCCLAFLTLAIVSLSFYRSQAKKNANHTFPFIEGDKTGLMDEKGQTILKPQFASIESFQEGFALAIDAEVNYAVIDKWGNKIPSRETGLNWSTFRGFHEGLAAISTENHLFGYIDATGKFVLPPAYEEAEEFHEGLARVRSQGMYGFINKQGEQAIPFIFNETYPKFTEHRLAVKIKDKWGYADPTGKIVIPAKFNYVRPFQEGFAYVSENDFRGFIDEMGNYIFKEPSPVCPKGTKSIVAPVVATFDPFAFAISAQSGGGFVEQRASVKKNGKYGYIDTKGKLVIPYHFDAAKDFSEGLAAVKEKGKWGFIDLSGKYKAEAKYEEVNDFSEGHAFVRSGFIWTFIDKNGKEIVPPQYFSGGSFHEGLAQITDGYIDTEGRLIKHDSRSASEYLRNTRIDLLNQVHNSGLSLSDAYKELDFALTQSKKKLSDKSHSFEKITPAELIATLKDLADYSQHAENKEVLTGFINTFFEFAADDSFEKGSTRNLADYYGNILSAWLKVRLKDTQGAIKLLKEIKKGDTTIYFMGAYPENIEIRLLTSLIQAGKKEDVISFIAFQTKDASLDLVKKKAQEWTKDIQKGKIPAEWLSRKVVASSDCL